MRKLADISAFEQLQNSANAGFVSDMSVFNGEMPQLANIDTFVSVMNSGPYGTYGKERGYLVKPRSGKGYHRTAAGLRDTSRRQPFEEKDEQNLFMSHMASKIALETVDEYTRNNKWKTEGVARVLQEVVPNEIAEAITGIIEGKVRAGAPIDSLPVQKRMSELIHAAYSDLERTCWGQKRNVFGEDPSRFERVKMDEDMFNDVVSKQVKANVLQALKNSPDSPDKRYQQKYDFNDYRALHAYRTR